jgi:hypothetical protein
MTEAELAECDADNLHHAEPWRAEAKDMTTLREWNRRLLVEVRSLRKELRPPNGSVVDPDGHRNILS